MKAKVKTIDLFSGRVNVRKYLNVDMRDEDKEWIMDEHGLTDYDIDIVLKHARMFVQMDKLPETIEVEVSMTKSLKESQSFDVVSGKEFGMETAVHSLDTYQEDNR